MNTETNILTTFSEFDALVREKLESEHGLSDVISAVWSEVNETYDRLCVDCDANVIYGRPLEQVKIPEGFEALRNAEGRIIFRLVQDGDWWLCPWDRAIHKDDSAKPAWPRLILRKKPSVIPAQRCVVKEEFITRKVTYRKTGEHRQAREGEFYDPMSYCDTPSSGKTVLRWPIDALSKCEYDIYEPIKEETTTAA